MKLMLIFTLPLVSQRPVQYKLHRSTEYFLNLSLDFLITLRHSVFPTLSVVMVILNIENNITL